MPFALPTQSLWTGLGIIGAWLAAILGLSYYARRWIGIATWRWLHRWTLLAYVLCLGHSIGSGTDSAFGLAALAVRGDDCAGDRDRRRKGARGSPRKPGATGAVDVATGAAAWSGSVIDSLS